MAHGSRASKRKLGDASSERDASSKPDASKPDAELEGVWQGRWMRGLLEACVLTILQSGPAYGYNIAVRFEREGFARPKGGTLYPILARLEKDGVVEPTWAHGPSGPSRKYYALTPRGSDLAASIGPEWQAFVTGVTRLIQSERTAS